MFANMKLDKLAHKGTYNFPTVHTNII